jgi:enoyl-CoA hydratase
LAYETLLVDRKEGTGIIILNRPDKLNALSSTVFREFDEALTELEQDDAVRVLLVTGAGEKAFSAGADIHEMVDSSEGARRMGRSAGGDWISHLACYKKPTIGVMNGLAYGGGALMSSIFDMRIGCERSSFRFLAVTYGRINSTWTLPLIVGLPVAKELLLTGRVVGAEEAYRIGLLNQLVPSGGLTEAAMETARLIAKSDPDTVQLIRKILNTGTGMGWQEMLANEARLIAESLKPPPPRESFKEFLDRKAKDK